MSTGTSDSYVAKSADIVKNIDGVNHGDILKIDKKDSKKSGKNVKDSANFVNNDGKISKDNKFERNNAVQKMSFLDHVEEEAAAKEDMNNNNNNNNDEVSKPSDGSPVTHNNDSEVTDSAHESQTSVEHAEVKRASKNAVAFDIPLDDVSDSVENEVNVDSIDTRDSLEGVDDSIDRSVSIDLQDSLDVAPIEDVAETNDEVHDMPHAPKPQSNHASSRHSHTHSSESQRTLTPRNHESQKATEHVKVKRSSKSAVAFDVPLDDVGDMFDNDPTPTAVSTPHLARKPHQDAPASKVSQDDDVKR